jgi:HEAT repeat protein
MHALSLVFATVVAVQQSELPPHALARLEVATSQDEQDPTDSLWRAARQALNRGDYAAAANLYGDVMRRFPNSTRAGDALYWSAFALYKNDDLDHARSLLVTQQRRYPKAATLHDGDALLARIQAALAKQGDSNAAAWLAEHARAAGDTAGSKSCPGEDDEDDVRVAALNGLLQMDATNALPILKKVLARRDSCSAALRRKAVFIVSQKRDAETENILLDVAQHDPDAEVRQQGVFWLSQVPTDRSVNLLDSILRTTDDEELPEKAIFALSQQHSPRAAEILRAYADNLRAPLDAREKAIFWLGQQHSSENAAFLRGLYAKLTEEDLKEKVIFSLSQMGGTENGRWLMDIALNEREAIEMRKKALFWAGQRGADLGQLVTLYDRMQDEEMKEQLIFVYSQRHEAAALDKLIAIAKTEQNRELRKKAVFWLGQSHDPRAAQALMEIINQ